MPCRGLLDILLTSCCRRDDVWLALLSADRDKCLGALTRRLRLGCSRTRVPGVMGTWPGHVTPAVFVSDEDDDDNCQHCDAGVVTTNLAKVLTNNWLWHQGNTDTVGAPVDTHNYFQHYFYGDRQKQVWWEGSLSVTFHFLRSLKYSSRNGSFPFAFLPAYIIHRSVNLIRPMLTHSCLWTLSLSSGSGGWLDFLVPFDRIQNLELTCGQVVTRLA